MKQKYSSLMLLALSFLFIACNDNHESVEKSDDNEQHLTITDIESDDKYYKDYWTKIQYKLSLLLGDIVTSDHSCKKTLFLDLADPAKILEKQLAILEQRFALLQSMGRESKITGISLNDRYSICIWDVYLQDELGKYLELHHSSSIALAKIKEKIESNPALLQWLDIVRGNFKEGEAKLNEFVEQDNEFFHKTSLELFAFNRDLHRRLDPESTLYLAIPYYDLIFSFEYWLAKKANIIPSRPEDDAFILGARDHLPPKVLPLFRKSLCNSHVYYLPEKWAKGTQEEQRKKLQLLGEEFLKEVIKPSK